MGHTYSVSTAKLSLSFAIGLAAILILAQQTHAQDDATSFFGKKWTLTEMEEPEDQRSRAVYRI